MTRIECTECGDLIETAADTVVLPFVCMKCEAATEEFENAIAKIIDNPGVQKAFASIGKEIDFEEVAKFYKDMAPKGNEMNLQKDLDLSDEDCAHWKVATVENTNLLIADLEEQLLDLHSRIGNLTERNSFWESGYTYWRNAALRAQEQLADKQPAHYALFRRDRCSRQ